MPSMQRGVECAGCSACVAVARQPQGRVGERAPRQKGPEWLFQVCAEAGRWPLNAGRGGPVAGAFHVISQNFCAPQERPPSTSTTTAHHAKHAASSMRQHHHASSSSAAATASFHRGLNSCYRYSLNPSNCQPTYPIANCHSRPSTNRHPQPASKCAEGST